MKSEPSSSTLVDSALSETTSSISDDYLEHKHSFSNLFRDRTEMVIIGHRGGFLPENTLSAFRQAKEHQLQAVELDVSINYD